MSSMYLVSKRYEWVPGTGPRGHEDVPMDLRDERGVLIRPLARWPHQPLEIEAHSEEDAVEQASRLFHSQGRKVFLSKGVTAERFKELQEQERPGSEGRFTSINAIWATKLASAPADDDSWHWISTETFTPVRAPAPEAAAAPATT